MHFGYFAYRHQRNKLKLDDAVPKPAEWQRLRHQHSVASMAAEMPAVPNLVIRRPSVVAGVGTGGGGLAATLKGARKHRCVVAADNSLSLHSNTESTEMFRLDSFGFVVFHC